MFWMPERGGCEMWMGRGGLQALVGNCFLQVKFIFPGGRAKLFSAVYCSICHTPVWDVATLPVSVCVRCESVGERCPTMESNGDTRSPFTRRRGFVYVLKNTPQLYQVTIHTAGSLCR